MSFEEYLHKKNIDSSAFAAAEAATWAAWKALYEQVHPQSFETQKKFLLNKIRRKYQLKS